MFGGGTSTEYEEIVSKTTDENLTSENWEMIMNLCDKVQEEGQSGAHAVISAILKRLAHRNPNVQLYALSLTEALSKNLSIEIHREIASRAFTQGLERLIVDRVGVVRVVSFVFLLSLLFAPLHFALVLAVCYLSCLLCGLRLTEFLRYLEYTRQSAQTRARPRRDVDRRV
ncbi:hypothetical protein CVT26_004518 [Gymnopilus dilepis]|uniref:VHS domain-containing protein n=1 Tax=Gymnopilus dilepis TaxID=231916 RepID=A0A409WZ90_9AGAR|nr:hypothetical protein CVT26_004518 [Gymnopilus dilepis]